MRSAHWSLWVIRYIVTRCLHGPWSRCCPPFWAQVELRKCLFTNQSTMSLPRHRSSTIQHEPEPMDRVRRCTGEMFQPTETQRTVNTLVPRCLRRYSSASRCPRCLSLSLSFFLLCQHARYTILVALIFLSTSFFWRSVYFVSMYVHDVAMRKAHEQLDESVTRIAAYKTHQ